MEGCKNIVRMCLFLKSPSVLCKELQADEVCIVTAIEAILKTVKSMEKVRATPFENLATVKVVLYMKITLVHTREQT